MTEQQTRYKWIWTLVATQAAFLLIWAGYHENIRQQSAVICLETHPVDPRDVLRGDYMILSYKISTVAADLAQDPALAHNHLGRDIWVVLAPKGGHYDTVSAHFYHPLQVKGGQIAIKGKVSGIPSKDLLQVEYGIERFFVPEGRGNPPSRARLEVYASVGKTGRLQIHHITVDGKPYP